MSTNLGNSFFELCDWIVDNSLNPHRQYMNFSDEYFVAFYDNNGYHTTKTSDKLRLIQIYIDDHITFQIFPDNIIHTSLDYNKCDILINDHFNDWRVTEENYFQYSLVSDIAPIPMLELRKLVYISRILHRKFIEFSHF